MNTATKLTYENSAEALALKFDACGVRILDIEKTFSRVEKQNPRVLEIGCGSGRDAREICQRTPEYLGIDYSESMIRIASAAVPAGKFQVADIRSFVFEKPYDIVFAFASLFHLSPEEFPVVLRRIFENISPGGAMFLSLKTGSGIEKKIDEFWSREYYCCQPDEVAKIFPDAKKIEITESNFHNLGFFEILILK